MLIKPGQRFSTGDQLHSVITSSVLKKQDESQEKSPFVGRPNVTRMQWGQEGVKGTTFQFNQSSVFCYWSIFPLMIVTNWKS